MNVYDVVGLVDMSLEAGKGRFKFTERLIYYGCFEAHADSPSSLSRTILPSSTGVPRTTRRSNRRDIVRSSVILWRDPAVDSLLRLLVPASATASSNTTQNSPQEQEHGNTNDDCHGDRDLQVGDVPRLGGVER